jgi:hypothetical protein
VKISPPTNLTSQKGLATKKPKLNLSVFISSPYLNVSLTFFSVKLKFRVHDSEFTITTTSPTFVPLAAMVPTGNSNTPRALVKCLDIRQGFMFSMS